VGHRLWFWLIENVLQGHLLPRVDEVVIGLDSRIKLGRVVVV
jgi:hypothetical protein